MQLLICEFLFKLTETNEQVKIDSDIVELPTFVAALVFHNLMHPFIFLKEHLFELKSFVKLSNCVSCKKILWGAFNQVCVCVCVCVCL